MRPLYVQRYLITGLLTFIPIWLTWVVFKSIFSMLSQVNQPWVTALFDAFPDTLGRVHEGWLISLLAFIVTVVALYAMGFATSRVFGQRLLGAFERLIERIPIAHSIYGGAKKLMSIVQNKPSGTQRVVLIDFPSPELKSLGFVTRVGGRFEVCVIGRPGDAIEVTSLDEAVEVLRPAPDEVEGILAGARH